MTIRRSVLALLLLAAAVPPAAAQDHVSITGTAKDADGGVLPGVTVTATNSATGFARTATSSRNGHFTIPGLPAGTYQVTARLSGFADFELQGLKLVVGTTAPVNFTMKPAGVEKTVTVTAERTIIQATESDVSTGIPEELIRSLPIAERNAFTLALLVPGVSASPYFDPTKSRDNFDGISFGAGNGSENLILVDGADNNDDVVGSILQFYPQDSIQEFEVVSSRFKAEYGHTDGGVLNMITKSGANDLSGGGYWLFRDDALNRRSFIEEDAGVDKSEFRQNIAGGYLGGPLVKDRAFYFGNVDYTKRPQELLTFTDGAVPQVDSQGQLPRDVKQTLVVGKVTANLGDHNFLTARYAFQDDETLNSGLGATDAVEHAGTGTNRYHAFMVKDQTVIGNDKLNEVFWQYNPFENNLTSNAAGTPLERQELVLEGTYSLGQNSSHPQRTTQKKHQLVDNFSWRWDRGGAHDFRAGFEWQHVTAGGFFGTELPFAQFAWNDAADFRAGLPADNVSVSNGPFLDIVMETNDVFAFFLQDDWKPIERLTLNLGLRYDLETNDWFQKDRTFISADPLFFGDQPGTDQDNFGPRLGLAYDAKGDGKLVARGGYGLYYQQILWNNAGVVPFREGKLQGQTNFDQDPDSPEAPVTFSPGDPFCSAPGLAGPGCIPIPAIPAPDATAFIGNPAFTGPDPRNQQPSTHQFSIGLSALLPWDIGLDADYVGTRSDSQLYFTRPGARTSVRGLDASNLDRNAFILTQKDGRATYDGLLLSVHRRHERLSTQVSYTFSRAQGHVRRALSGSLRDDTDAGFDNNFGPIFGQRNHLFAGSLTYTFPWELEVGTIVKLQSGFAHDGFDSSLGDIDGDGLSSDTFAGPSSAVPGDGKRGAFRGDGYSQVDLRMAKKFTIAGKYRPQVFFEIFNLFNTRNEEADSNTIITNVNNPNFGHSSSVGGQPFQGQLSVRFDF